ncbi:uncharacterized protein ALTATR162_LOCUS2018 [Alternaria atra]|uniref:Uncharacterized protein n=1 Tax=Alternaria atra TaxID=119953 RepID=A0A8J2HXQ0_9PLEO|nr:uncharacterized protein ALTATR162_LOCUS2018 [Alternaria atra]CAG5147319.1 unnamed protein product [Alternaria atra]
MSTLGFMMPPSQYGMGHYGSPQTSYSSGYPPLQSYAEPRSSNSNPYSSSYASSPVHNESQQRRPDQHTILPPYQPQHPSLPRSPYQQQQSTDPLRGHVSSMAPSAHSYTYSAPHNSVPNQSLGSNTYSSSQPYPATTYGSNEYHPLPTMYPPTTTTPTVYPSYESSQSAPPPSGSVPALSSSPSTQVTFYDINEKNQELRRKAPAPGVEPSSHALLQGTDTWRMINASQEERQKQADK